MLVHHSSPWHYGRVCVGVCVGLSVVCVYDGSRFHEGSGQAKGETRQAGRTYHEHRTRFVEVRCDVAHDRDERPCADTHEHCQELLGDGNPWVAPCVQWQKNCSMVNNAVCVGLSHVLDQTRHVRCVISDLGS